MKEFWDNYSLYIYIGLEIIIILVIVLIVIKSKKKKIVEEEKSSILDVNIEGVVDKDFEYGYEKEDTVIIKPEEIKKAKKSKKKK